MQGKADPSPHVKIGVTIRETLKNSIPKSYNGAIYWNRENKGKFTRRNLHLRTGWVPLVNHDLLIFRSTWDPPLFRFFMMLLLPKIEFYICCVLYFGFCCWFLFLTWRYQFVFDSLVWMSLLVETNVECVLSDYKIEIVHDT